MFFRYFQRTFFLKRFVLPFPGLPSPRWQCWPLGLVTPREPWPLVSPVCLEGVVTAAVDSCHHLPTYIAWTWQTSWIWCTERWFLFGQHAINTFPLCHLAIFAQHLKTGFFLVHFAILYWLQRCRKTEFFPWVLSFFLSFEFFPWVLSFFLEFLSFFLSFYFGNFGGIFQRCNAVT